MNNQKDILREVLFFLRFIFFLVLRWIKSGKDKYFEWGDSYGNFRGILMWHFLEKIFRKNYELEDKDNILRGFLNLALHHLLRLLLLILEN